MYNLVKRFILIFIIKQTIRHYKFSFKWKQKRSSTAF